jgi:hypothetical protein
MKPFQTTAVRVCGGATLVMVGIVLGGALSTALGRAVVLEADVAMGLALLVAVTAFVVANTSSSRVAVGMVLSAVAVIGVLLALQVYKAVAVGQGLTLSMIDATLVAGLLGALAWLCREVLRAGDGPAKGAPNA